MRSAVLKGASLLEQALGSAWAKDIDSFFYLRSCCKHESGYGP
jgi:hypothetical protein